jgi:hypothetical protein
VPQVYHCRIINEFSAGHIYAEQLSPRRWIELARLSEPFFTALTSVNVLARRWCCQKAARELKEKLEKRRVIWRSGSRFSSSTAAAVFFVIKSNCEESRSGVAFHHAQHASREEASTLWLGSITRRTVFFWGVKLMPRGERGKKRAKIWSLWAH